jgi:hypothetical protein
MASCIVSLTMDEPLQPIYTVRAAVKVTTDTERSCRASLAADGRLGCWSPPAGREHLAGVTPVHLRAEAREGERKEPRPEPQAQMEELAALSVGEPEYFNFKQPGCTPDAELDLPGLGSRHPRRLGWPRHVAAIATTLGVSRASIYRHLTRPGS